MFYIKTAQAVTVICNGVPYTVDRTHPTYDPLMEAVYADDEAAAEEIVTAREALNAIRLIFGDVEVYGGHVLYRGRPLHNYLVRQILAAPDDIEPMTAFLNNVMRNPSRSAVEDLYAWCEAGKMPLTRDGCIVAYKIVNTNYTDCHSGTFDNSPGKTVEMPRNEVDDDPNNTCSAGLHFCSAGYLPHYGAYNSGRRIVLVKVNPADVVAFPKDYSLSKARCCKYVVLREIPADTAADFFPDNALYYEDYEDVLTLGERLEEVIDDTGLDIDSLSFDERILYLFGHFGIYPDADDDNSRVSAIVEAWRLSR